MPTLDWIGKDKVVTHHLDVPVHELVHKYGFDCGEQTDSPAGNGNMVIHGDNLIALKSLLPDYEGRVDCIYIDPPYNTGNEKWVYNDNVNDPRIEQWLGEVVGKEAEDFTRHDKWLCMMYPRLELLRKLMSPDGAIFISIDSNEFAALKQICDRIFNNFVGCISWQRTYSPRNDSKGIAQETEYIMVYSNSSDWQPNRLERTEDMDSSYKNPDNDWSPWTSSDAFAPGASTHQGMVYAIQHPFSGELIYPYQGACWRYDQKEMLNIFNGWCQYELRNINDEVKRAEICGIDPSEVREGVCAIMLKEPLEKSRKLAQAVMDRGQWPKFYFTKNGQGGVRRKSYLAQMEGKVVTNLWPYNEVGHTDEAKKELKDIFNGNVPFDTPKPSRLIERILHIATHKDSIVLDSFAGSGTTGQAVLNINKRDGGNRRFILVEMMDYADTITAERVKRVITGYTASKKASTTLFSKKLSLTNLPKAPKFIEEAKDIAEREKDNYDSVKVKLNNNAIEVEASTDKGHEIPGIPGAFDFYEVGEPIFVGDYLNPNVGEEALRRYIFFSETRKPLLRQRTKEEPYFLDKHNGVAYYFYYEPDHDTELSDEALCHMVTEAGRGEEYIIYANSCTIEKERLKRYHITFKKIPREIRKF